jgi:glycosyltransferase involved in cell wall biosynthesis
MWSWPSLLAKVPRADAVILQRELPSQWQSRVLRRLARYLIFDFDDAVFGRDSYAPKGIASRRRWRRFGALCAKVDAVVAGNACLARNAMQWSATERIHVIPTCVEPGLYPLARHQRPSGNAEIVWLGSSSTLTGLEAIRSLLDQLGERIPGLRLKLVCDRFLQLDHLPVVAVQWTETGEAAELAGADIGISWMPDDAWSRGKCGLKLLQYMAAGLPVVANPVGVHREMVRHGENGYLAETAAQWQEAIGRLANEPELRARMGATGRRRVESDYSVARGAELWLRVLDSLAKGRQAA